jgi:subtilisin-like proprotein convertase family protein
MRKLSAALLLILAGLVVLTVSGWHRGVQSQSSPDSVNATQGLDLWVRQDASERWRFRDSMDELERSSLVKLATRFVLADPECPLPWHEPAQPFYVRFREAMPAEFADQLMALGAAFVGYAFENTHFVRARDEHALSLIGDLLRQSPLVAGTVLRLPQDQCHPAALELLAGPAFNQGDFSVLFWRDVEPGRAAGLLAEAQGEVLPALHGADGALDLDTPVVDVRVDSTGLATLAASPLVEWLSPVAPLMTFNVDSAALVRATPSHVGPATVYNLTGDGLVVGVWDGGTARATHEQFQNAGANNPLGNTGTSRVLRMDTTNVINHATHVTGTIVADGTNRAAARGFAPKAYALSYYWGSTPGEMNAKRLLAKHIYRIVADNHSYGTQTNPGGYDSYAQASDLDIRDMFLNMFKAAGNFGSGSNTLPGDSCMKNSFTIGATQDDGTIASFSSRGPAADGRVVPHFMANGTGLLSTYGNANNTSYSSISGTSMASPSAAGAVTLLTELWNREMNGQPFAPDVARGIVAATAEDLGNPGPDYRYGWGLMNVQRAADLILANKAGGGKNIVRGTMRHGGQLEYPLVVSSSAEPLRVVLSWLDIWANVAAGVVLVNDLDIELVAPDGMTIHYPWRGLDSAASGTQTYQFTRSGPNRRDNLEVVDVTNPAVGTWRVRVRGHNIPSNPQTGVPNAAVGFVLVCERPFTAEKLLLEDPLNGGNPLAIPDNNATGVVRTFNVAETRDISGVRVFTDIHHPARGHLSVSLKHPDGTTLVLQNSTGSTRPDLIAVFPDTRQYGADVLSLLGKPANGAWEVRIADTVQGDSGEIRYLALELDFGMGTGVNNPPVANAGPDQIVLDGDLVSLNGTLSSDPDGDPLTYQWLELGSNLIFIINNPNSATPTFTAPAVTATTDIILQLTVNDGRGGQDTDTVMITVVPGSGPNTAPVADAGANQSVIEGVTVYLDGSASFDPDPNDVLTYKWSELGTSYVILNNATSAVAHFVAPAVTGTVLIFFELEVSDGRGGLASDLVEITVSPAPMNLPPVADAGPDRTIAYGRHVRLDGRASFDPEGEALSFLWMQVGGNNIVAMSSDDSAQPTFITPEEDDVLVFRLTVEDPSSNQDTATVTITVDASGGPGDPFSTSEGDGKKSKKSGGCAVGRQSGISWGAWLLALLAVAGFLPGIRPRSARATP